MIRSARIAMLLLLGVLLPTLCSAAQEEPASTAPALRVRVVDGAGHPVAGATVRTIPAEDGAEDAEVPRPESPRRTAADGNAQIPLGTDGASFWLLVEKSGSTPSLRSLAATAREVKIALEPGTLAVGRVVDEAGRPVAGVEVELNGTPPGVHDPWDLSTSLHDAFRRRVRTGPEGRFRLRDLPAGSFEAVFRHPDHAPLTADQPLPGGTSGPLGTFVLRRGTTLRGTVTDPEGQPLAGARIWALAQEEMAVPDAFSAPSALTAVDGSFAVPHRPDGSEIDLWVCAAGFLQEWESIAFSDEPLQVVMQPAGAVRGRVFGPGGEPLAGAIVQIALEGCGFRPSTPCGPGEPTTTDGEGRFALAGIFPDWITLTTSAPGLVDGRSERILVRAGELVEGVEIHLRTGADLEGRVLDPDHAPIAGASVWGRSGAGGSREASTGADGSFLLAGLEPGPVTLEVSADRFNTERRTLDLPPTGLRTDLVLERDASEEIEVSGRVLAPDGAPAEGALVAMAGVRASSGWDGSFTLRVCVCSSGHPQELTATKLGFARGLTTVLLYGPRVDGVEIRLEAGAWVHGIVSGLDAAEMKVAGVSVEDPEGVSEDPAWVAWSTRIDASGKFRLGPIPSGAWNVQARVGLRSTLEPLLVEPGQAEAFVELSFDPSYPVSGRVLDPEGRPVAGADLRLLHQDTIPAVARTRQDGSFQLAAPAGDFTLSIDAEPWAQELPLRITNAPRTELEIRLEPGTTLHGRMIGAAPEKATLNVSLTSHSDWRRAELLPDGTWRARGLTPGLWTVQAVLSLRHGYQTIGQQVQIPPGLSDLTLDLDFTGVPVLDGTGEEEP